MRFWILACLLLVASASPVLAHLDGGEDKQVGEYLVDFGYTPETLSDRERALLSFNLVNPETEELVDFSHLWLRISAGNDVVFAGTLYPEEKHVVLSYVFPYGDEYEITTAFFDGEDELARTDFVATVEDMLPIDLKTDTSDKERTIRDYMIGIAVLDVVLVLLLVWYIRRNQTQP